MVDTTTTTTVLLLMNTIVCLGISSENDGDTFFQVRSPTFVAQQLLAEGYEEHITAPFLFDRLGNNITLRAISNAGGAPPAHSPETGSVGPRESVQYAMRFARKGAPAVDPPQCAAAAAQHDETLQFRTAR